jgi:hypothetical protein
VDVIEAGTSGDCVDTGLTSSVVVAGKEVIGAEELVQLTKIVNINNIITLITAFFSISHSSIYVYNDCIIIFVINQ